jgi:hypothetical protein
VGYIKSRLIEEQERGFRSVGYRFACPDCVGERALSTVVREAADSPRCDYCETASASGSIAMSVDSLLQVIMDGLNSEYGDPAEELPWEGEYIGETMDTHDVLDDAACDISNADLLGDIVSAFGGREWCKRDYFRLRDDEALIAGWDRFADQVMHRIRYFFLSGRDLEAGELDAEVPDAANTLIGIGKAVDEVGLVRPYPAGTRWLRARSHGPGEAPAGVAQLGPAPAQSAGANRMSPAGIPMFYGTRERATAVSEITAIPQKARDPLVTIGTFVTARASQLVDLTDLPPLPSLFDESQRYLRGPVQFLRRFVERISQPISRDGAEHIEYVPTQVVTEWFRHIFTTDDGVRVDGLVYPSVRDASGVCCVLFADRAGFCDIAPGWQQDQQNLLALETVETVVVHRGYQAFMASPELETSRADGLRALQRTDLFDLEEWNEFIRRPRTPEYEAFCGRCREVAARFDLMEYVVRRACLLLEYSPESEPFPIEAARPHAQIVAAAGINPVFLSWLLFAAAHVGLPVVYRDENGAEATVVSLPMPIGPSEPLLPELRPSVDEAFALRLDVPADYPQMAASAFAQETQDKVHRLLEFLGYPADRWVSAARRS